MDIRQSPLILGFSLGRYFGVTVRMSVWFFALIFILCWRLPLSLGVWVSLILFLSILLHEFAHVFGARATGGHGDEVLLWPLGGLAFVSPAGNFRSEFWTTAAGPLSNLVLCLVSLPAVLSAGVFWDSLHPIMLPPVDLNLTQIPTFLNGFFVLVFALNLKLFVLNLLPIHPLDGGQLAFSIAKLHWDRSTARIGSLFLGMVVCLILALGGLLTESVDVVFLSFLLLTFGLQAHMNAVFVQQFGDVGFAYGPSEEDEYGLFAEEPEPQPTLIERWRQRRTARRREREAVQRAETSRKVDALLEKINQQGIDSLSDAEKKFLQQASSRYKTKQD